MLGSQHNGSLHWFANHAISSSRFCNNYQSLSIHWPPSWISICSSEVCRQALHNLVLMSTHLNQESLSALSFSPVLMKQISHQIYLMFLKSSLSLSVVLHQTSCVWLGLAIFSLFQVTPRLPRSHQKTEAKFLVFSALHSPSLSARFTCVRPAWLLDSIANYTLLDTAEYKTNGNNDTETASDIKTEIAASGIKAEDIKLDAVENMETSWVNFS